MKNVGSAVNGEETLNRRKNGNNSGRSSSRKECFSNLQRTWVFTSSVLQMARQVYKRSQKSLENGKKSRIKQLEEKVSHIPDVFQIEILL